jgi:hypothetical protein
MSHRVRLDSAASRYPQRRSTLPVPVNSSADPSVAVYHGLGGSDKAAGQVAPEVGAERERARGDRVVTWRGQARQVQPVSRCLIPALTPTTRPVPSAKYKREPKAWASPEPPARADFVWGVAFRAVMLSSAIFTSTR